jgi:hypothetical protein
MRQTPFKTMLSLFRSKKEPATTVGPTSTQAKRMDLEERKAFRREMLYQSIRETFLSMEVIGSMYKFKVMPVDERHHRFVAMIDVAKSFVTGRQARTKSFAALEKLMRVNTYKRFGILIEGTYWRVSESENQFEHKARQRSRAIDKAGAGTVGRPLGGSVFEPPIEAVRPVPEAIKARHAYQPVSDDEANAFMEALRNGLAPPIVRIGDMEYQSDLAPLDGGIMIGGTQYGKL